MYRQEFIEAFERSSRLGLKSETAVLFDDKRFFSSDEDEKIQKVINEIGVQRLHELFSQCFLAHIKAKPIVEKHFGSRVYFTLGYITVGEYKLYYKSENDLEQMIQGNIVDESVNLHAWLTLPTLEIIDLTFSTTYALVNNMKDKVGAIITKHVDDFNEVMAYNPMLVGEEFLFRSGILRFEIG
jgi:hypothetical protein